MLDNWCSWIHYNLSQSNAIRIIHLFFINAVMLFCWHFCTCCYIPLDNLKQLLLRMKYGAEKASCLFSFPYLDFFMPPKSSIMIWWIDSGKLIIFPKLANARLCPAARDIRVFGSLGLLDFFWEIRFVLISRTVFV